jgi:DNA-binding beta-propeller fold protein YncE
LKCWWRFQNEVPPGRSRCARLRSGAAARTVSAIATSTNTVTATIGTPGELVDPFGVAITPGGKFVDVTNSGSDVVALIATASNTIDFG